MVDRGVVGRVEELLAGVEAGRGGALWRLTGEGRQLDANVVRLRGGEEVARHVEPDLDVLVLVVAGEGRLTLDDGTQALTPGTLAWLPRGTGRSVAAGGDGLAYLTVHRRRPGLTIGRPPGRAQEEGGEAACLLHRLCPACDRPAESRDSRYCARCGTPLPAA